MSLGNLALVRLCYIFKEKYYFIDISTNKRQKSTSKNIRKYFLSQKLKIYLNIKRFSKFSFSKALQFIG